MRIDDIYANELIIFCHCTDFDLSDGLRKTLTGAGLTFEWKHSSSKKEFGQLIKQFRPNLVFAEHTSVGFKTKDAFQLVKAKHPHAAFILLTEQEKAGEALDFVKQGVDDCIFNNDFAKIDSKILKAIESQLQFCEDEIQKNLINSISEISGTGGWHYDVLNKKVKWTEVTREIHEVEPEFEPTLESSFGFYKKGWSQDAIRNAVIQAIEKGEEYDLELIIITPNGKEKWVRTMGRPILENKKCTFLLGTFEDISQEKLARKNLKTANQRLKALLNNLNGATFQYKIDSKGNINIVFVSEQIETLHEVKPKEALEDASLLLNLVHPESQDMVMRVFTDALANKKEYNFVFRTTTKSGVEKWIETVGIPSFDEENNLLYNVISWDVTSKIREEQELEKLSLVAKETTNCIIITDRNGYIEWVNEGFTKFSGYQLDEVLGYKPGAILQGQDTDQSKVNYLRLCVKNQKPGYCEILNYRKNGTPYWIEIYLTPIFSENGDLLKFIAIENDVTKRRKQETKLKENNVLLKKTIDELTYQKYALDEHAIVAITDVKGTITYANKKFCDLSKYSFDELIGKNHRILNSGLHSMEFFKEMYATISKGKTWNAEIRNKAKDGTFYWVDTSIVPFMNKKTGKPERYVSIRSDITEAKEYQNNIMRLNEKYEQVIEATNDVIWEWDIKNNAMVGFNSFRIGTGDVIGFSDAINLIHIEDRARVEKSMLDSINDPKKCQWEQEYRMPLADGVIKYVFDRALISRDENGVAIEMIGASQDITEKTNYLKWLKSKNERLIQIAWAQSHELRAPLANVLGIVDLLPLIDIKDQELKKIIYGLRSSANKMDDVIKKIVEMTRVLEEEEG